MIIYDSWIIHVVVVCVHVCVSKYHETLYCLASCMFFKVSESINQSLFSFA